MFGTLAETRCQHRNSYKVKIDCRNKNKALRQTKIELFKWQTFTKIFFKHGEEVEKGRGPRERSEMQELSEKRPCLNVRFHFQKNLPHNPAQSQIPTRILFEES